MKRFIKHLLSIAVMLALAFTAAPADAKPGKKGKGLQKHGKNAPMVQASKAPRGSHGHMAFGNKGPRDFGDKGHFDGRRQHYVRKAPPPMRRAHMQRPRRAGYTWIPGTWRFSYRVGNFVWVDGTWARTRPGLRWVDGHWAGSPHGWYFVSGYWM
ncbi:MAG: YXWGXW repeat-containing protein [Pseudomonadota bacterium]